MKYGEEKPNSQQLMESFYKAQEDITALNTEVERIRNTMNTKLSILNSLNAYTASMEQAILEMPDKSSNYRIIFNSNITICRRANFRNTTLYCNTNEFSNYNSN